ncbi:transaldolase family protein [Streptomyces sp. NPDC047970]|uniref:transaldolase family protein n=1 Tax=Streptomyces sp. NPDC047970 TaxID=3155481 RepID=UPI003442FE8D
MQSRPPCRSQKAHSRLGKVVSREAEVLLRQLVAEGVSPWLAASRSEQLDAAVLKAPDFPFQGVVLPPGGSGDLVRAACDALAPVFTTSGGAVGQVSAPVDPRYAEEPGPLLDAARTLHRGVARPNLVVRIPMTGAGVQVLADCLAEGIGVDATLVFSTEKYAEVLDAYVDGMERALISGRRLACISAVTTFPVGAFEQEVDARLERLGAREARGRRDAYAGVRELWHNRPVDTLFPPTLKGDDAGPGGADRVWNRIAVAPDTDCAAALDPLLATALRPVGCERVVRATYSDATASSVTTVGMVFTEADGEAMLALHNRFTTEGLGKRRDLMPRTLPAEGTVAEGFGSGQRASWTVRIETDAPVVVFAVSGFADGRTVEDPRPATEATEAGATSTAAQAGLGHDAQGIAERIGGRLRTATTAPATEKDG